MTSVVSSSTAPIYDEDYYSDAFILDPYPHYAKMRALGPVVYLPRLDNYAVTRFAEVREVLRNWQVFSNAHGIAGDAFGCEFFRGGSNLVMDPPTHDVIRAAMWPPLKPTAVAALRERVDEMASALIERLVERRQFDGMADLARYLPETLVTDLVGLPDEGRENMLLWAASAFDVTGVQNERGRCGAARLEEMRDWIVTRATPDRLKPGSLTARIRDMVERGEVPRESFMGMMNDYITPSLDTTISATGELLYQLAKNPDQWALLKSDSSLIEQAVNECVRIASPIRSFTRTSTQEYMLSEILIPAGARVMVMFASANHDDRRFPNPERYDIQRKERDHMGFGHGVHSCLGMHLAKMEMAALLRAMLAQVDRIEVGEPSIALNNTIHAFSRLPVTFHTVN